MQNDRRNPKLQTILIRIIRERQRLGYSQEYMGSKMGISQNAYSKVELGYTNLTVDQLFLIANILDCPVEELIQGA